MLAEAVEELDGALHYINEALILKETGHTDMSKAYYSLAQEEVKHATTLHSMSQDMKSKLEQDSGSDKIVEYISMLHEKYKENLMKVKLCILMYDNKI